MKNVQITSKKGMIIVAGVIIALLLLILVPEMTNISLAAGTDVPDPGTVKAGYTLIWADEFDGTGANLDPVTHLNLDNWSYQLGDGTSDSDISMWGNAELQCYTRQAENISVDTTNGVLTITAIKKPNGTVQEYAGEAGRDYSSARIRSTDKANALFNLTYGYVEARMKLPTVAGAWPAFWMLPQDPGLYTGWPSAGEIDIMESVGCKTDAVTGNAHWGTPNHMYQGSGWYTLPSGDIDNWHTYAVNWEPGKIEWIYDGVTIYTLSSWTDYLNNASSYLTYDAPFDQPFYLLLDLAVDSGSFGGTANDATQNPSFNVDGQSASMEVDYVRAYQKTSGYTPVTGNPTEPGQASDWSNYVNQPQIVEITATNLVAPAQDHDIDHDDSACSETLWHLAIPTGHGGQGTLSSDEINGKVWAKCSITNQGNLDYSYQLIGHFDAKGGYAYKMSFDAYATGDMVGKTVYCNAKETVGWTSFASMPTYLTDKPTHYAIGYYQPTDFNHCRLEFNMGAVGTGDVYISNVSLEIVDPATWREIDGDRHALPGGEYAYNGTFDQGINRLAYWNLGANTSVTVPSFTTTDLSGYDAAVVDVASKTNYEGIPSGIKYYERRAEISAPNGIAPKIYQNGLNLEQGDYVCTFDMYSDTDSAVKVQLFSTKNVNGQTVFDEEIGYRVYAYDKATEQGVMPRGFEFTLQQDYDNIAAVFTFAKGTKVALDNVHLIKKLTLDAGISEGNLIPINKSGWVADNGHGAALPAGSLTPATLTTDPLILTNIESGNTWYSYQLLSPLFNIENAYSYKLSFKYKIDKSNDTFQIMLQKNGTPWTVALQKRTVNYDASLADAAGFCTYELVFNSMAAVDNCRMIVGFGNSGMEAPALGTFTLKDCVLEPHYSNHALLTTDDHLTVDPDVFIDDPPPAPPAPTPTPAPEPEPEKTQTTEPEVVPVKNQAAPPVTPEPAEEESEPESETEDGTDITVETDNSETSETITEPEQTVTPPTPPQITEPEEEEEETEETATSVWENISIYVYCFCGLFFILLIIIALLIYLKRKLDEKER